MTDRHKVYTKVVKTLKQMMEMSHQGYLATLAMMITGIVRRNAQLSQISSEVPLAAKDKNVEMRLRRWVKNTKIDADVVYIPFARQILVELGTASLILVTDSSQAGRGCMVLMVGVLYKKRALPIAWVAYKGKKGHTTTQRHIQALEKVLPLLPNGSEVVLLGDAEYDTAGMLVWMETNTDWQYVLRTSQQIYVQESPNRQPIGAYPLAQGRLFHRHQVGFTQDATVSLNLIGWWGSCHEEPIFLVTNVPNVYQACRFYRCRFQIETFFGDQKSHGFHIHKSHLSDPARFSRMLIAACLAYTWMICQGLCVIASNNTDLIDRIDCTDKSLFCLGLDWIKHALKRNLHLEPMFWFQPATVVENVR